MNSMPRALLFTILIGLSIGAAVLWYQHESGALGVGPVESVRAPVATNAAEILDGIDDAPESSSSRKSAAPEFRSWRITPVRVVRDEDDTPIAGAEVMLSYPQGDDTVVVKTTDESGTAEFETAFLEDCTFRATVDGRGTTSESFRGKSGVAHGLRIPRKTLSGPVELRMYAFGDVLVRLVDDDGRDLREDSPGLDARTSAGLRVRLVEATPQFGDSAPARERIEGSSVREADPAFPFQWRLQMRGGDQRNVIVLLGSIVLAVQPIAPSTRAVAVCIRRDALDRLLAPIVVRVVGDADGVPMPGVAVTYTNEGRPKVMQRTDEHGLARFARYAGGAGTLTIASPGFVTDRHPVNQVIEGDLVLRLRAGRMISGVLLDAKGVALSNKIVSLLPFETSPSKDGSAAVMDTSTLRNGVFRFTGVDPGRYRVAAGAIGLDKNRAESSSDVVHVDCRMEDQRGVVLRKPEPTPYAPRAPDHSIGPARPVLDSPDAPPK